MSAIALLMGLLVLSYVGSLLVGTGKTRGLASGIEFIGLGFAVGPHALGLIEGPMITEFEPIIQVALGWLAFVIGLDFGRVEGRRVGKGSTALGIAGAVVTGVVVGTVVWQMLLWLKVPGVDPKSAIVLAAGAGVVCAESSRYAVEWTQARWGAKGRVTRLLVDIGAADDLAPLVAAGAIFSISPSTGLAMDLPPWGWLSGSVALGALLGVVTALLLRGAEAARAPGALIGTLLLIVGTALRTRLCTIFVTFVMGIALAAASSSRRALRKLVSPTERSILYPMLLLAGARLNPAPLIENQMLAALLALVLLARIVGKLIVGILVRATAPVARPAGPLLGIVLLSSGPVSVCCGLVFALRFPGPVGDTLLICAVASAVLGELVSTFALRNLLTEAGEMVPSGPGARHVACRLGQQVVVGAASAASAERRQHQDPHPDRRRRARVSASTKDLAGRGVDILCLASVLAVLWGGVRLAPGLGEDAGVVVALGALLLVGTLMSKILEVVRLPHLTGYLIAGMIAGPYVLHLIEHEAVKRLAPVNTLALALIALGGGAELRTEQVKRTLRSLAVATAVQNGLAILCMGGIFLAISPFVPFVRDLPPLGVGAVALLWGIVATIRSPSSTLGILAQTRARGPLASFAIAFVMTSDVVVLILVAGGVLTARALLEPSASFSFDAITALGHEILGSVAIGTTLGLLLSVYLRLIGTQLLVVLVAIGFGATEVLHYLRFDPLLTFLVAGFVVQNLSKQGDKLLHAVEEMGGVVYVIFFAFAGADLDIPLLRQLWPLALVLAACRAAVTYSGARVASALAKDPPTLKKWAWSPLVAQAGLTLGLAAVIAREFPAFGAGFRALVFATVAINEVIGPILFKFALDRAGESKGPAPSLTEAEDAS